MDVGFSLLFFAAGTVLAEMAGKCDMVSFFQELGCTATSQLNNYTGCPESFECPDLHPNPKKCYYRGVAYNAGDVIPQSLINNPCIQDCKCNIGTEVSFQCASVDCVETFNYRKERDVAKLTICEVDGKRYKEGEKFNPKNTRKSCLCTAEWNGTTDDVTYCTDIDCGIEIHYQNYIMNRCAPVFLGSAANTCPIEFKCPTNTSKLIQGGNTRNFSHILMNRRRNGNICYWGQWSYKLGSKIRWNCDCRAPPYVTCYERV